MVKTLVHMFLAAPVLAVDASCAGESCTVEQYSLLQKGIHASEKGSIDCLSSKCEPLPPKKGCETFFGRGAASHDQIISIVDPDVPALFCDLFKQKAPCTFIHRAQAAGDSNCVSPTPPDKCHQYIKVTYSKCDGLEAIKAGTVDVTGIFDPQTGVFKGCEGNVTSTDYTYWAPNKPISDQPPPTFPETYEAIKCSQPVVAVQDSWDHHFTAFGGQNLDEIVKDYSDDAEINIVNWVDGSMQTFRGLEGVRKAFAGLFAQMTDLSDLGAPVVQVDEQKGSVFLIWKNPASGYQYGTDSFMVNSEGKFVRQHVVVSKLGSDAAAAVVPDPAKDGLPTHSAWKRHFAAFGSQSLDDIVVDYSEDAKVNVFNQADGVLTTYNGHSGVRDCFTELFANLHDLTGVAAPIQVVEEATDNRPGRVLLLWSAPASGYMHGTDTFVTNQEGKFTQQNVVVNYQPTSYAGKGVKLGAYPGYAGDLKVTGEVNAYLSQTGTAHVTYDLKGLEDACKTTPSGVGNACGIHIHEGKTCADASAIGGHYYDAGSISSDPWSSLGYNSRFGSARGSVKAAIGQGEDIAGRAMVVHDSTGARVACATLPSKLKDMSAVPHVA